MQSLPYILSVIPSLDSVLQLLVAAGCQYDVGPAVSRVDMTWAHNEACHASSSRPRLVYIYLQSRALGGIVEKYCPTAAAVPAVSPEVAELLHHPAFSGIVLVGAYELDPVLLRGLERFVDRTHRAYPVVDLAVHIRHRAADFDVGAVKCVVEVARSRLAAAEPGSPVTIYLATDWTDTLPEINTKLRTELPTITAGGAMAWTWESLVATDAELLERLLYFNRTIRNEFTGHSKTSMEGWWGPTPTAFGLLEMFALAALRTDVFVGSKCSTFTEIALGLHLFVSASPSWDAYNHLDAPRLFLMARDGACAPMTAQDYATAGIDYLGLFSGHVVCDRTPAIAG